MAKNNNLTDFLTDTANAIRTKKGTTGKINPQDFSSEIASIQTGPDTSDATATEADLLAGKTAYANGAKITGTIETYAGDGSETVNKLASLVDGTLTEITADDLAGTTKIADYALQYNKYIEKVTIPDSVTSIGKNAFYYCQNITSVTIPDSVTSIGDSAFSACAFTNIVLPKNITRIGEYLFSNCSALIDITIPNSVTSINRGAFIGCRALKNIAIPDGVTFIYISAFQNCSSLTNIVLPLGITSIGNSTFYACSSLTNVVIKDNVTVIGSEAFWDCTSLTNLTIPSAVTSIGSSALQIGSATNKATITMLPTTPPTIQSSTFKADYLQKIIVPAGTGATYKAATNWSNFADYIEEATA